MAYCIAKMASLCISKDDHDVDNDDPLLWSMDLPRHSCGDFSIAVVQANEVMEDHCQVETGSNAIFVGIYDGHRGPQASNFLNNNLFDTFRRIAKENGNICEKNLAAAVKTTEASYLKHARRCYAKKPLIATVGSCCLACVIWKGTVYITNVGDSRAVLGRFGDESNKIIAEQLSISHNIGIDHVRQDFRAANLGRDNRMVSWTYGRWLIKGVIHVTRSIGDLYLKEPGFPVNDPRCELSDPIARYPVITEEPSRCSRVLRCKDKFLIFASSGLWQHITNQEAVEIVHKYPRNGIARRLIKAAQKVAADENNINRKELQNIEKGTRRNFHDDITVIVVFIDHELLGKKATIPELSYRGFIDAVGQSNFSSIKELM